MLLSLENQRFTYNIACSSNEANLLKDSGHIGRRFQHSNRETTAGMTSRNNTTYNPYTIYENKDDNSNNTDHNDNDNNNKFN